MISRVICPNPVCQKALKVPSGKEGAKLQCPGCKTIFRPQPAIVVSAPDASGMQTAIAAPPTVFPEGEAPAGSDGRQATGSGTNKGTNPHEPSRLASDREAQSSASTRTGNRKSPLVVILSLALGGLFGLCLLGMVAGGAFLVWSGPKGKSSAGSGDSLGKYGSIEIGSKGVKAIVVDFFSTDEGYDFELPFTESSNIGLATLAPNSSDYDPKAIDDTVAAVKNYYEVMKSRYGLSPDHVFLVSSSGVYAPFKNPAALNRNKERLASRIKEATGNELVAVDSREEARLSILTCVPASERTRSLLIDIGSGNTKGGHYESMSNFISMNLDYGTSSFSKAIAENSRRGSEFATADRLRESLLVPPIRQEISRKPVLGQTPRIYLLGGIVWAMASFTHPTELSKTRVLLNNGDIKTFERQIASRDMDRVRSDTVARVASNGSKGKELAEKVDAELKQVGSVFKLQQLLAGLQLLKALASEYEFQRKQVIFFRKGQYAWSLGYIIEQSGIEKPASK